METLHFSIDIKADKQKVWKALWDESNYRDWTSAFMEGSYAVSDSWKEGSRVQFLAPGGSGMYSTIERHIPNELMSFKHIGIVKDGKEQPVDEDTKKWTGSIEKYTLLKKGDHLSLNVEVDTTEGFTAFMRETFPKALARVKEISENE